MDSSFAEMVLGREYCRGASEEENEDGLVEIGREAMVEELKVGMEKEGDVGGLDGGAVAGVGEYESTVSRRSDTTNVKGESACCGTSLLSTSTISGCAGTSLLRTSTAVNCPFSPVGIGKSGCRGISPPVTRSVSTVVGETGCCGATLLSTSTASRCSVSTVSIGESCCCGTSLTRIPAAGGGSDVGIGESGCCCCCCCCCCGHSLTKILAVSKGSIAVVAIGKSGCSGTSLLNTSATRKGSVSSVGIWQSGCFGPSLMLKHCRGSVSSMVMGKDVTTATGRSSEATVGIRECVTSLTRT